MAFGTQTQNGDEPSANTSTALLTGLHSVDRAVAILGTKMDSMTEGLTDDRKRHSDHETRIRSLESRMWWAMGVSSGFASGLTVTLAKLFGAL
jgi:hypothetical protein